MLLRHHYTLFDYVIWWKYIIYNIKYKVEGYPKYVIWWKDIIYMLYGGLHWWSDNLTNAVSGPRGEGNNGRLFLVKITSANTTANILYKI